MVTPCGMTNGSVSPPVLSLKRQPPKLTACDSKLVNSHQSAVLTPVGDVGCDIASVMRRSGLEMIVSVALVITLPWTFDAVSSYRPALVGARSERIKNEFVSSGMSCPLNRHSNVGAG